MLHAGAYGLLIHDLKAGSDRFRVCCNMPLMVHQASDLTFLRIPSWLGINVGEKLCLCLIIAAFGEA